MAIWVIAIGWAAAFIIGMGVGMEWTERDYRNRPVGRHEYPRRTTPVYTPLTPVLPPLREETDTGWLRRIGADQPVPHKMQWDAPNARHSCKHRYTHPGLCECICGAVMSGWDIDPEQMLARLEEES